MWKPAPHLEFKNDKFGVKTAWCALDLVLVIMIVVSWSTRSRLAKHVPISANHKSKQW